MLTRSLLRLQKSQIQLADLVTRMRKRIFDVAFPQKSQRDSTESQIDELRNGFENDKSSNPTPSAPQYADLKPGANLNSRNISWDLANIMLELYERQHQMDNLLPRMRESQHHIKAERARMVRLLDKIPYQANFGEQYELEDAWKNGLKIKEDYLQNSVEIIDDHLARQNRVVAELGAKLATVEEKVSAYLMARSLEPTSIAKVDEEVLDSNCPLDNDILEEWETELFQMLQMDEDQRHEAIQAQRHEIEVLTRRLKEARAQHKRLQLKPAEVEEDPENQVMATHLGELEEKIAKVAEELTLRGEAHRPTGSPIALTIRSHSIDIGDLINAIRQGYQAAVAEQEEEEDERYPDEEEVIEAHNSTLKWIENVEEPSTEKVEAVGTPHSTNVDETLPFDDVEQTSNTDSYYGPELSVDVVERARIDAWASKSERAFLELPEEAQAKHARGISV